MKPNKPNRAFEYLRRTGIALAAVGLLAGCGREDSANSPDWEQQLAEIERQYAAKGVDPAATGSAARVRAQIEGLPEQWRAGREYELVLVLAIEEGWHVNANPATFDYLIPTQISFREATAVKLVSAVYPGGHPFGLAQIADPISVYEGTVRIPFRIAVGRKLATGAHEVTGHVMVQACDDQVCLAPGRIPVRFTMQISES